jgi:DNA repair protein RadA/Sms
MQVFHKTLKKDSAMGKPKTRFVCQECGTIAVKWQGRCAGCGNWNTIVEEAISSLPPRSLQESRISPELLDEVSADCESRLSTSISEFDQVLGGGIVPGSIILIGGPPGIGKSTLLLHIARGMGEQGGKVLYVSGEESPSQIKLRYRRLGISSPHIFILPEINLDAILAAIEETKPMLVLIDSIQTLYKPDLAGAPGSVTQVRECTASLLRLGKTLQTAIIIVGHVTKDGSIAGPRVLEHLVDTVLYFEGEGIQNFRVLKSAKNRFGSTNEVGIFQMDDKGLTGLRNASAFFLSQRGAAAAGSVIVPVMEGTRALLVELQALVTRSYYGIPSRKAKGIDVNRVALLIAVLEKRAHLALSTNDVFVNVVGGVEIDEPAVDLGLVVAMASSFHDAPIRGDCIVLGEVGLGGEIRGVTNCVKRVQEAERLGFTEAIIPSQNIQADMPEFKSITLHGASHIKEAIEMAIEKSHKGRR